MIQDIGWACIIISWVGLGLVLSNRAYDSHMPHYLSRKIGHFFGGVAYLICYLVYTSGVYPLILSIGFAGLLLIANLKLPSLFRGVGGSGRPTKAISEAAFPLAAIPVIGIGWIVMDEPSVTLAALLFMAWGDCITGIVRSKMYGKAVKGTWGSVAMFGVCCAIAGVLVEPIWVGILGAFTATIAEKECGDVGHIKWADDNFAIPVIAATVMLSLV
jgi:dolichol kinase